MSKQIEEIDFTIFDTETTGLDPACGERVVEIAGIRFAAGNVKGEFDALINCARPVSAAAFAVNKITPQMLETAAAAKEVIPAFLEFSSGSYLCSYNAEFDLGFLNNELRIIGMPELKNIAVFDILTMARKILPGLERYALWFVAKTLGISGPQEHRALSDVKLALDVFSKLKARLLDKGVSDFAVFAQLFAVNNPHLAGSSLEERILRIEKAISAGARMRIKYLSTRSAEVSQRQVVPKEIRQDAKYRYLVAYCCLKNEERTFRIDNILDLEVMQDSA